MNHGTKAGQQNPFETESFYKVLLRIAPPVMLAQLIQALYNIVDSYFIGQYSKEGLTALSILFPIQLVISALAIGTGVGVNTLIARLYAQNRDEDADKAAGTDFVLALLCWGLFALVSVLLMRTYVQTSTNSSVVADYAVIYGNIVCAGSFGIFLESIWTKVHQAGGNMRTPMYAQIIGALTNIVLDPLLIFGWGPFPEMGIAGAAVATVLGQFAAAAIVGIYAFRKPPSVREMRSCAKTIYALGYPSILMQTLFTVYIVALNVILASFSDDAVTVLGLYYKIQTFFFIPLMGLQTCIVPVLSYNYARARYDRCKRILMDSIKIAAALMVLGILCFELIPQPMISLFTTDLDVLGIGAVAFRIVGASFLPAVVSLMMPVFFQAISKAIPSVVLSLTRQIFCLIPIFWALSRIGLDYAWIAFPIAELVTGGLGMILYLRLIKSWSIAVPSSKESAIPQAYTAVHTTAAAHCKRQ